MPEKSSNFDDDTLKKLIQLYINSELMNYGVTGLNSCFNSRIYGNVPSVVIDRLHYDSSQKLLTFEVVYVCTQEDAIYVVNAQKCDNKPPKIEGDVYDDEL